jgi:haloacetate dehalogenase
VFDGFETRRVATSGAEINLRLGGSGPPLLLLHGYPQTHVMWHRVAPYLAERFTVVAADLRGYGDSAKPASDPAHATYSKRAMARDQVEVMSSLGFERFAVVGHDRGARVAHRMALDHPDRVERAAVLDICPTLAMYERTDMAFASGYYHWFFLIQPYDLPERLIAADPDFYLESKTGGFGLEPRKDVSETFDPAALEDYKRCFRDPAAIHASCEDYRAAATIDLDHDRADLNRKIACPLLVLWGTQGLVGRLYDVLGLWRERAGDVTGRSIDCGHYLAEEAPADTLAALQAFL